MKVCVFSNILMILFGNETSLTADPSWHGSSKQVCRHLRPRGIDLVRLTDPVKRVLVHFLRRNQNFDLMDSSVHFFVLIFGSAVQFYP